MGNGKVYILCSWILAIACSAAVLQKPVAVLPPETPTLSPASTPGFLPVVIWHGLGDTYDAEGLHTVGALINDTNPGTYTYYIRLDDDASADRTATFIGNLTIQIEKVCADLAAHPILSQAPAINAVGFSQGGQFLRAYVERCNRPRVANLVTFGSQHNGIAEFQKCASNDWLCRGWDGFLKGQTWTHFVQSRLVPAQYFRDPDDLDAYLENSNFLADINNERYFKNATYKENLKQLDKFAMYVFADDTTVVPKETAWFSEVDTATGQVTRVQERKLYKEDWLGLRFLDERKRLDFRVAEGRHMQLTEEVLVDAFKTYFGSGVKGAVDVDDIPI